MINSKIEWTDATWNPIRGCSRVSEGCRNCYAEKIAGRFSGKGSPYEGLATLHHIRRASGETETTEARWTGTIAFVEKHLLDPLKLKKPSRIFVNSMSDLFHEGVKDEWLDRIFTVMGKAQQHTFQILTKRPERMRDYMPKWKPVEHCFQNVWLGVSVEDQKTADERIPLLMKTPAAVRFISAEPLLGPISLRSIPDGTGGYYDLAYTFGPGRFDRQSVRISENKLDWVICGGESGPGARPMHPGWARSLRDECQCGKIPFFFKQWGEYTEIDTSSLPENGQPYITVSGQPHECCDKKPLVFTRVGKKSAGRLLDGREWNEYP